MSFITLTLRHNSDSLRDQIRRVLKCFKALRETVLWKARVAGGAYFLEVKRSVDGTAWHAHLHVIAEAAYVRHDDLSAAWRMVTGDSFIVDIRRVSDEAKAAGYVAKYVTKPVERGVLNVEAWLDEALLSLRGRRMLSTFGLWRGWQLESSKQRAADWIRVASLEDTIKAAGRNERWAFALIAEVCGRSAGEEIGLSADEVSALLVPAAQVHSSA